VASRDSQRRFAYRRAVEDHIERTHRGKEFRAIGRHSPGYLSAPWSRSIEHQRRVQHDLVVSDRVSAPHTNNRIARRLDVLGLAVVQRAAAHRVCNTQKMNNDPLGAAHPRIGPHPAAFKPDRRHLRPVLRHIARGQDSAGHQLELVWSSPLELAELVVDAKRSLKRRRPFEPFAVERHHAPHRFNESREHPHEPPAFTDRIHEPRDVHRLEIAEPAVENPHAVPTGRPAEVIFLDKQGPQPALRGFVEQARAVYTATDDDDIMANRFGAIYIS